MPCRRCHAHVTYKSGIVCANYGYARGGSQACSGAWCAGCFVPHEFDRFEVAVPRDFYGASLAELEDEVRHRRARPGDHLCCTFQCPGCQSHNVRGKPLVKGDIASEALESLCIRATLDAFWRRASRTVKGHLTLVQKILRYAEEMGIAFPFPRMGPFPMGHHLGMLQAIMVLRRSLDPGRGGDTLQYGTARKVRAAFSILWDASVESGGDIVLSSSGMKGRCVATLAPSESRWYQHFAAGCCARMGDVVHQDRAYTIRVLLKLVSMFELQWGKQGWDMPLADISACVFLLVTCLGGRAATRLSGRT